MSEFVLKEGHKAALFVVGSLHCMEKGGLITKGKWGLEPKGVALFDQLEASGYRPTPDQVAATLRAVLGDGHDEASAIGLMIDEWDKVKVFMESEAPDEQ